MAFADVPVGGRKLGVPFYVGREWRPTPDGTGTVPGPDEEAIAAADVRVHDKDDEAQRPDARRTPDGHEAGADGHADG